MPVKKEIKQKTALRKAGKTQAQSSQQGYVKSYDGTKIWYTSMGKGTPLIFCNGLGCSTFFWKHIHSYFKGKYRVILFDWRCHGKSETINSEEHVNIEALTQDLHALYKKLQINKAVLAGHSMGTQVLFHFYNKYPKKVLALIPCCGTFGKPMDTFYNSNTSKYVFASIYIFNHLFPTLSNSIGRHFSKVPFWWETGTFLKMLNPGLADKKVLKEYIEHFTAMDSVILTNLASSMQEYNAEPLLHKIKVPTLIIAGEKDTFTPLWISKKMHHLIPKSELLIIKKASHVVLIEQPALINLRMEKFLQEHIKDS